VGDRVLMLIICHESCQELVETLGQVNMGIRTVETCRCASCCQDVL
jgi:hypothetical protein